MIHPFTVGQVYANRIGSYEVVRLNEAKQSMLIRYLDTGDTVESPINIQARIWENMDWEQQEAINKAATSEAGIQKGYGEGFSGLKAGDFKVSTEDTSWRSRKGLAGKVALLLSEPSYKFVSWPIYRWPVAFLTHHQNYQMAAFEHGSRKAKFTIEMDEEYIHYGFYIERSNESMDHSWDWPRFQTALLNDKDRQREIETVERKSKARFLARISKGKERFHFSNGIQRGAKPLWNEAGAIDLSVQERLRLIETIPEGYWGEVYIVGAIAKDDALKEGGNIVEPIVQFMRELLPIYKVTSPTITLAR